MLGLPLGDWQFWVVTPVAVWGAWMVVRMFVPRRKSGDSCPSCASGSAATRRSRKVRLTVEGRQRR